jgi:hypothetical protein
MIAALNASDLIIWYNQNMPYKHPREIDNFDNAAGDNRKGHLVAAGTRKHPKPSNDNVRAILAKWNKLHPNSAPLGTKADKAHPNNRDYLDIVINKPKQPN